MWDRRHHSTPMTPYKRSQLREVKTRCLNGFDKKLLLIVVQIVCICF